MRDMNTPQPATQRMGQYDYKVFLFHSLSGRTPFWIRGKQRSPGARWGYCITSTSPWRIPNCNSIAIRLSTPIDSLQVIDKYDIVAIDSASTTPRNPFFAEFGGTAQPAVPTGAPRFRTTLRWFRRGMDLGPHPPAGVVAELGIRFPNMPGHAGTGGRAEILALHLRRDAALAAVQRDRPALRPLPAGPRQPDHQDR